MVYGGLSSLSPLSAMETSTLLLSEGVYSV